MCRWFAMLLVQIAAGSALAAAHGAAPREPAGRPPADDVRARIVESTLRDLSARNDAATASKGTTLTPAAVPTDGSRAEIKPRPVPESASVVTDEVQSSLHRLRRETAARATVDGRKARVNENLDRATERGARTAPR